MYIFQSTDIQQLSELRQQYLNALYESQELFLELMVPASEKYIIQLDGEDIGYFMKLNDNYLIEFYLKDKYLPKCSEIFHEIVKKQYLTGAYCKSFDSVLLKVCCHLHKSMKIVGVLYRNIIDKEIVPLNAIDEVRIATMSDFKAIAGLKEGVFDTEEEIEITIKKRAIFIFKNKGDLIGYGIFQPAVDGQKSYDIGMAVAPNFRRKGYGTFILNYLKNHCIKNGWQPTCGCAVDNIASQKTIEKTGFVSRHNMLAFAF